MTENQAKATDGYIMKKEANSSRSSSLIPSLSFGYSSFQRPIPSSCLHSKHPVLKYFISILYFFEF
jgi:hypothetical protein